MVTRKFSCAIPAPEQPLTVSRILRCYLLRTTASSATPTATRRLSPLTADSCPSVPKPQFPSPTPRPPASSLCVILALERPPPAHPTPLSFQWTSPVCSPATKIFCLRSVPPDGS